MTEFSGRQRLRYGFDNFMAKGGKSFFIMLTVLFLASFVAVVVLRIPFVLLLPSPEDTDNSVLHHAWTIFLEMTDPGNMGEDSGSPVLLKIVGVVAGVTGVVIFSMLIAFITTEVGNILEELKKGRSQVVEHGHTLILGWNYRVIEIIRELIIANESESYASVVVLSEEDKEKMDDDLKEAFPDSKTTRIVTRCGNTSTLSNLKLVNAGEAKSIIVLASCSDSASNEEKRASDLRTIKAILALEQILGPKSETPIIADVFSGTHSMMKNLFKNGNVLSVDSSEILGKVMVQSTRSSGLSAVVSNLFSFEGSELYFHEADWNGLKFSDAPFRFKDGVPFGVKKADGTIMLNPADRDMVLGKGDKIIIYAEDDSSIKFEGKQVIAFRNIKPPEKKLDRKIEKQLFLGWHSVAPVLIKEFADYLLEGSSITVVMKSPSETVHREIDEARRANTSITIELIEKDPLSIEDLESLKPFDYSDVMILSTSEGETEPEKTDIETVMILVMLRSIREKIPGGAPSTKIITQIMNSENDQLIATQSVDDFIVSNAVISKLFASLSEEPELIDVYMDLFSEEGSEIYLKPAWLYFEKLPFEATFADVIRVAQQRSEVCFGVRIGKDAHNPDANFGIITNPAKDSKYLLNKNDWLVVLAENES